MISQFHIDEVDSIPHNFTIIGSSKTCRNECMVSSDKRILSFQFHMEYSPEYAKSYEKRLQRYRPDYLHGEIFKGCSEVISNEHNVWSLLSMRDISRKFMN